MDNASRFRQSPVDDKPACAATSRTVACYDCYIQAQAVQWKKKRNLLSNANTTSYHWLDP